MEAEAGIRLEMPFPVGSCTPKCEHQCISGQRQKPLDSNWHRLLLDTRKGLEQSLCPARALCVYYSVLSG